MRQDFAGLLESLRREPQQGVDLGRGLHKVRMAISSKGKGKSGGARVITLTVLISETDTNIVLLTIYDKSECENLTDKELTDIVKRAVCRTALLILFLLKMLLLGNAEPIHIHPSAIISHDSRTCAECSDLSTDPLSFPCLKRIA